MDKYERVAAGYGVELEGFTSGYLDLYGSKGISVLERFIKENPGVLIYLRGKEFDGEELLKKR